MFYIGNMKGNELSMAVADKINSQDIGVVYLWQTEREAAKIRQVAYQAKMGGMVGSRSISTFLSENDRHVMAVVVFAGDIADMENDSDGKIV